MRILTLHDQVLGFVLLVSFAFFERYFAKIPFLPFQLLTRRTIFATVMLDATVQVAYYCWNDYYTSFLQVRLIKALRRHC